MDSLIFCFVILLAVGGLVLLIVAITKSTMGGARAFQCEVCCSTVGLSMGSCRACGAGSDRPGQDRLKHYRASLWDLRSFYNNGKIPFDTYALLDGLFRERASHVIQNLGSRRGHLAKVPNYPDETMASASEKEPEPVTDGVVKEPEEVEAPPFVETEPPARAAPEEERLAPTPRPAPPVSPELAEWKWQEILAKTFFFLGVLAATALAFSSLYTYGGEYHPLLFMIFPGATLGIFAAAIAVKRLFDFTWSSLAFSLLSAVLLPICYYAAARFQVVSIERPMLEWGWVALGCSILYALGSRVAGERTLLFLAALTAPTGFTMILGESALREGFLGVSLLVPAGAYLAYAQRKAGDPFRGPVFRLAAFTNIVAGLLLVLILKSIGAADLLDVSITGWALACLVFVVGLQSGRDRIQYVSAVAYVAASLLALQHFSTGRYNHSPFEMAVALSVVVVAVVLRRKQREGAARPLGHVALAVAGLAFVENLIEIPPFQPTTAHAEWSIYAGAILLGGYFVWKLRDSREGAFLLPILYCAYALVAMGIQTMGRPLDDLWLAAVGVGLGAYSISVIRPDDPEAPVGAVASWCVVPLAAAASGLFAVLGKSPAIYPLLAIPAAGLHALSSGISSRRSIEISVAGAFFAAIPLFVILQFERPWDASPAFMMAGAVILAFGMGRIRYRWGEAASRPLAVYAIGLSLLALLLGAAVLFFHAVLGSFSISTISTIHLALAGAGAAFLHLRWARTPSREWHLAPLNAGCLLLLFAGVEALDLSGHFYALLPALLAAINAGLSRSEGAVRYRRPLAWCAVALVIATLVPYVPAVYALSTQPSAFWPVVTALISALAITMVASGGSSLTLRRAAISLVFLAVLFQLTLNSPAFDWRPLFAAFALAGCFVGYLWARVGIVRWGRAAVGVSALVALVLAGVALIRVATGDMGTVAATFQFTFCAFALGISGLSAQQGTLQRALAPLIILAANLSLLGGTLSFFAFLDYTIPIQGILLSFLAIAFMVLGIRCERRNLGLLPGVFYCSIGIVAAISVAFTWGTVGEAVTTYFSYAAVFGIGGLRIRRELFFYAAAFSFSLGFLFLMRYARASALTVAMWEASLAIAYVGAGRFFFPRRSWNTDPLLLTALPMALGVVVTFVVFRSRALDIGPNLLTSIRTSLILAGLFATMAWTARERRFYALSLLMGLSAYYLTLRLQGAVLTEWFTTPPAFIAAGIGVLELKGKTKWLGNRFPPGGLIVLGLLVFYVPALYRSLDPKLLYEAPVILITSMAILLGSTFWLRVRILFWGGAVVFLLNLIIWLFVNINFAAVPKEVWWGIAAVVLISSGLLLEKRVNARLKERVALAKGKMEKFFAEWV